MKLPTLNERQKAYVQLHSSVVLYGFTAILGKLITLFGPPIVFYRMGLTLISLFFFPRIIPKARAIPRRDQWHIAWIGMLVALHWTTFYEAIKYSNASITLAVFASTAFVTSILEPIITKRPVRGHELILGLVVIAGLALITGASGRAYLVGIIIAVISVFIITYASILNKQMVEKYDVYAITLIEFIAGFGLMAILLPVYLHFFPQREWIPTGSDIGWLLVLALLCTTLAYTLTMNALKVVSAFTSNLAINMEPVYGILMAAVFLQEYKELSPGFYLGALIVLGAVILHPILERRAKRREARKMAK